MLIPFFCPDVCARCARPGDLLPRENDWLCRTCRVASPISDHGAVIRLRCVNALADAYQGDIYDLRLLPVAEWDRLARMALMTFRPTLELRLLTEVALYQRFEIAARRVVQSYRPREVAHVA